MSLKFVCDGCGANETPSLDAINPQKVKRKEGYATAHGFIDFPRGWVFAEGKNGRVYHACSAKCAEVVEARTAGRRI